MTRKKSGFLTFCFSLIPGAGEMYMGFMKQGLSIMAIFWCIIFFATFISLGPLLFVLPILWCYSFFNVHNIRGMSDEEFYALEDDYLFRIEAFEQNHWRGKLTNLFAGGMILVGVVVLWQYLCEYLGWLLPEYIYWGFVHDIPQVVIAVLLIFGGIYLIRGKKEDLDSKEKYDEVWQEMPKGQRETGYRTGADAGTVDREAEQAAAKALPMEPAGAAGERREE